MPLNFLNNGYFAGTVGIGTDSPDAKLHVKDATATAVTLLQLESSYNNPSGNKSIYWSDETNNIGRISVDYTAPMAKMRFGSFYNSGYQTGDVMVLQGDGNVGIGDTLPAVKLQVSTNSPTNNVATLIGDGWVGSDAYHKQGGLLLISGTSQNSTQTGAGIAFQTRTTADNNYWKSSIIMDRDGAIRFTLGGAGTAVGSEDFTILSGGDVGIGTTGPAYKLDVSGGVRSTHFRDGLQGNGTTSATAGWYKVASWTGGSKRGGSEIKLSTTGGSFTPITWIIRCFKNWSYDATLKLEQYGYANVWFTKARIVRDTTTDILYVEIYQPGTTAITVQMYQTSLMGYDSNVTMVTGTLAAGTTTANESVRAELPFIAGGTSVEALTIGTSGNTGPYLPLTATSSFPLTGGLFGTTASFSDQVDISGFTNNKGLSFRTGFTPTNVGIMAKAIGTGNRDGIAIFGYNGIDFTVDNGNYVAMRVVGVTGSGKGNIGIGTLSPGEKLEVDGSIKVNANGFFGPGGTVTTDGIVSIDGGNGTGGEAYLRLMRGGASGFILNHTATAIQVRATANIPMFFYTNDTLSLKINANNTLSLPTYGAGYLKTDGSGNVTADSSAPGTGVFLPLAGGTMDGTITMNNNRITSIEELRFNNGGNIDNQINTDVDTGTETVANVAIATYTAAFFDFVVKKGTNVRSGTVYACHDGTSVVFTETSTNDLGDTSDVTLSVDISGTNMRLLATVTSDDWSVKSLIRAI